jgi:ubiquinone/menaquinone biosynthesis C-methylase UbiE
MSGSIYNTKFDIHGREYVKNILENIDKEVVNILIIGSPDVKELSLLSENIKSKINLFVFDMEDKKIQIQGFKSYYFKKINVFKYPFDGFEGQMDIVFHRWFLHHCTEVQKNQSIEICKRILKPDGKLIIIDWFIPDFNSKDEFKESVLKYYEYQIKYGIAPNPKRWNQNIRDAKKPNGKGGKFTSVEKLKEMLLKNDMKYDQKYLCPDFVDNPKLFGQSVFVCEKL